MTNWSWSQIRDLGIAGSNLGKRKKVNGEGEGGRKVDGEINVSSVSSFFFFLSINYGNCFFNLSNTFLNLKENP